MTNTLINITIFTPTYNRIRLLERLYKSLIVQSSKDFEWIIVDDGSSDTTEKEVKEWIKEEKVVIKYFRQINAGKHLAINKGVELAKGTLFFIVDSDDYLLPESLNIIIEKYKFAKNKYAVSGVVGRRQYETGLIVGNQNFTELVSNSLDIRYKHNVAGDLVEVYELEKIKGFSFPEFENEKFCPEALVWNRLAVQNNLFFFNQGIYVTEYLEGGLTDTITKIRMQSPNASMLYYSELESYTIPIIQKIKTNINFWRFSFNSNLTFFKKIKMVNMIYSFVGFPIGLMMYFKDKKTI